MEPQKKFSTEFIITMLFFTTLFIIGIMNLDNIAQHKKTPEEIKYYQKKYLEFSFKGKYEDLVGISGAAMYLEIEPEEINGYDKCFFPRFKKKNGMLYLLIPLNIYYSIPFNEKGVIFKNKGKDTIFYTYQGKRFIVFYYGIKKKY